MPNDDAIKNLFAALGINIPDKSVKEPRVVDPYPAVREPEPGTDFLPPDVDIPAVPAQHRDLLTVLEEIAYNTQQLVQPDPGIIWQPLNVSLPSGSGETTIRGTERVRFVYVPNVPRNMRVYTGSSRGLFLASLSTGQTLNAELPYSITSLYVEYDTGVAGEQINAFLSSRALSVSVNPAGAVWG